MNSKSKKSTETSTHKWIKVETPTPWHATEGEIIEGQYGGSIERTRSKDTYRVHIVHTAIRSFYVSGTIIDQLFSSAQCQIDDLVKVVFIGMKQTTTGHPYKMFELYVDRS